MAEALDVALGTVYQIKRRFTEAGLDGALWDRRQVNRHRKLDDRGEAHLIALACSPAPEGHEHWTLRLLAGPLQLQCLGRDLPPRIPENAFMEHFPQRENVPQIEVFHTPHLRNSDRNSHAARK